MTVCGIKQADGVCVMGKCPYIKMCCPAVWDKSGKVEMTNEEWLRQCTTEQLAEFLIASIKKCKSCASGIGADEVADCPFGECGCHFKDEVVKWLKQPHTVKE